MGEGPGDGAYYTGIPTYPKVNKAEELTTNLSVSTVLSIDDTQHGNTVQSVAFLLLC